MNWFPLLKSILMATAIGISRDRHKMYCLIYFYLWALYALLMPTPSQAGLNWYWFCISGEVSIIATVFVMRPKVAPWIIGASVINIFANVLSLIFFKGWIYPYYPFIIRSMELTQCIALVIWSQPVIAKLEVLHSRLLEHRRTEWMRRLLKLVTT